MGIGEDQNLGSSVSVTIIATGFGADQQHQIVNTEAKKIIHTLEEDQTLEHNLMGSEENPAAFEMPQEVESIDAEQHEIEVDTNPLEKEEEESVTFLLDVKEEEEIEEEHLFSIPVVAETLGGYIDEPETIEAEEEQIATTPELQNMEVVYELLESDQFQEELEIETEEEFIINDLDEEVLDLEVVGSEEVAAEEENQFAFDFGLPISDSQEVSSEKIVHTLSEEEEEEVKEDPSLSEAIDFEFEVVEKLEETPVLETEEVLTSPHDDSPFDKKIKETATKKNEERKEHLKKFNHAFKHSMSKIDEFEKQPAYKRMGLELEQPSSSESNESRLSVDNDKNDEIQLRSNNSFLHDNVD
jgi:cell division protein FtsZ